jgi:uncharacterized surface protein with fasciclin (FAS1) repeats
VSKPNTGFDGEAVQEKFKILMVSAVWGDWHINAHLAANVPTLLAPGNLPHLAQHCDLAYRIYTRRSDFMRLMSSPVMKSLSRVVSVDLQILAEDKMANPYEAHQWAWQQATDDAKSSDRFILFIPPDVAWADGAFLHIPDLLLAGKKAIFMTYVRVISDTFVPALQESSEKSGAAITVPPGEMVNLALHHLHPIMAAYSHDSPYFPVHAEMIVWPVRNEGLLVRVLAREMFLYDPREIDLTPMALMSRECDAGDTAFIDDSDILFAVSLAPLGKDAAWHMEYRVAAPLFLAQWWLRYDSPANDFIASTRIRWHIGPMTPKAWRWQEIRSDRLIRDTIMTREGLRIWRVINEMGHQKAASLLALAIGQRLFSKAFRNPSRALILVPSDETLQRLCGDKIDELAKPKNALRLLTFLRHHVVFDSMASIAILDEKPLGPPARIELVTAAGQRLIITKVRENLLVNGRDLLTLGGRVGRYTIYRINNVLDPDLKRSLESVPA